MLNCRIDNLHSYLCVGGGVIYIKEPQTKKADSRQHFLNFFLKGEIPKPVKMSNNKLTILGFNFLNFSCQGLADIIPKDSLLWKLKLLKSAASYANSRLHAVTAEVLVLARLFFSEAF